MTNKADHGAVVANTIKNSIIQIINNEGDGLALNINQAQELEQQYLQWVIADCASLEWLDQVKQTDEKTPEITLDSVYTALLTNSSKDTNRDVERTEQQPYSAVEMLNRASRLVITGAPGSGKSALVNFLCICMAGECLQLKQRNLQALTQPLPDADGEDQEQTQTWEQGALIPLRIILRDFASSDFFPQDKEQGEAVHLINFINDKLAKSNIDYGALLQSRLRRGEVLLMLDGLDEVPNAGERRQRLRECITAFYRSHSSIRILVTARPYAYEKQDWKLSDFQETALVDFTKGQIIRFINRWYSQCAGINQEQRQQGAQKLKNAIFKAPALEDLACRPLLLTLISFLHSNRYDLPDHRADLYERLLELLIEKWEKARFKVHDAEGANQLDQYSLAEYLQVGVDAIRAALERLAFDAHASQTEQTGTADIAAEKLSHQLMRLANCGERESTEIINPAAIQEYLRDRVGILYQRGGNSDKDAIYTFPHRSFQEYLAAVYFRRNEKALHDRYPSKKHKKWWQLAANLATTDPDRWREVIVLTGGIRSFKEPENVWNLLDALVPKIEIKQEQEQVLPLETLWGLRLAAEILAENLNRNELVDDYQEILDRIRCYLPELLKTDKISAKERVAAGKYLAKIGDFRPEIQDVDAMLFCQIVEGDFYLGSNDADSLARDNEKQGAGIQELADHYALARYPVTVAQFRQFVEDGNYQPKDDNCLQGSDNSPVAYVTWDDAIAFCDWLTKRWRDQGWLESGWRVDLPSEPEWEKAAKGGLQIPLSATNEIYPEALMASLRNPPEMKDNPQPQRLYPWGNEIDSERLNYRMEIGEVSAVGSYPLGASPYGCEEMSGNVWEWTGSLYQQEYPETSELWSQRNIRNDGERYALRGGSFCNFRYGVRCAARSSFDPSSRDDRLGFRVVLSPFR